MRFIDLKHQYLLNKAAIDQSIQNVLDHGQFILGPEVGELETRLADFVGVKQCITVASGTTALQLALMALDVKAGDEVITSPFSFFSSSATILQAGAHPVFVDIDARTYNIDPDLIEAAITSRTKGILATSLYGQCADFDAINTIAKRHGLWVIEDGAQSFGALYKGKRSSSLTTIGCTSFFPSKPLGCYGDGGACFTDDEQLAEKIRILANHGQQGRYHHVVLGINGRFDTLQAAILLAKLDLFPEEITLRQVVAEHYHTLLQSDEIQLPFIAAEQQSVYGQYTIAVPQREKVQAVLQEQGIPTAIHYPKPIYQQPAYQQSINLPVVEKMTQRVLSLPFDPYLKPAIIQHIANAVLAAINTVMVC